MAVATVPVRPSRFFLTESSTMSAYAGLLMLLSWSPAAGVWQLGAYLAVPATVLLLIVIARPLLSVRALLVFGALTATGAASAMLEGFDVRPTNLVVVALTYGSILVLVPRLRYEPSRYGQIVSFSAFLAIFELLVAVAQFVTNNDGLAFRSMAAGDHAVGTLLGNSHLFSVKMILHVIVLTVAAVFGVRRRTAVVGAVAAVIGVVLSSALFSTALGLTGIALAVFGIPTWLFFRALRRSIWRLRIALAAVLISSVLLFVFTQPANVRYVGQTVDRVTGALIGANVRALPGKLEASLDSLALLMSDPKVLLVGTGPGHYSSRAALILSGGYLAPHAASIPVSNSTYTETLILPRWNPRVWSVQFQDGVMNQPFHSIQSVLVEFGLIGALIVLVGVASAFQRLTTIRVASPEAAAIQLTALMTMIAMPFLLLSDNWLEYPHAAVPLFLPLVLAFGIDRTSPRRPPEKSRR